jgi:hypothetical protein
MTTRILLLLPTLTLSVCSSRYRVVGAPRGQRHRHPRHAQLGSHVLVLARLNVNERAFYFVGPASYVRHEGELSMAVTWRLRDSLPGDQFQAFAAAVA